MSPHSQRSPATGFFSYTSGRAIATQRLESLAIHGHNALRTWMRTRAPQVRRIGLYRHPPALTFTTNWLDTRIWILDGAPSCDSQGGTMSMKALLIAAVAIGGARYPDLNAQRGGGGGRGGGASVRPGGTP